MRRVNKQRFLITILVFILFVIGIGYAYLTSNLSITGSTKVAGNTWDIHFEDLVVNDGSVAIGSTDQAAAIDLSDTTNISYSITLSKPGDYYEFMVKIANTGTINGIIDLVSITGIDSQYEDIIKCDIKYLGGSDVAVGDIVNAGTKRVIKVKIYYEDDIDSTEIISSALNLDLEFNINYTQTKNVGPLYYYLTEDITAYTKDEKDHKYSRVLLADTTVEIIEIDGDWAKIENGNNTPEWIFIWNSPGLDEAIGVVEDTSTFKVTIFSDRRTVMTPGETVHLTSYISGFDGYEIMYVWYCDKHDGQGFVSIPDSNFDHWEYTATSTSLAWDWQLEVYYRDP